MAGTAVSATDTADVAAAAAGALGTGENMFIHWGLQSDFEGVSDDVLEILVSQACEITVDLVPLVRLMFDMLADEADCFRV